MSVSVWKRWIIGVSLKELVRAKVIEVGEFTVVVLVMLWRFLILISKEENGRNELFKLYNYINI